MSSIDEILSKASKASNDTIDTTQSLATSLSNLDLNSKVGRLHSQLLQQAENYERLEVIKGSPFELAAGAHQSAEKASEADRSINPRIAVACRDTDSSTIYFADKTNSFAVHTTDDGTGYSFVIRTSRERPSGTAIVARGGVFDSDLPEVQLTKESTWFDYYIEGHTDFMTEMNDICQKSEFFDRVGTDDPPFANSHPVVGFASSESLPDSITIEGLHEWAKSGKLQPLFDALSKVELEVAAEFEAGTNSV